MLLDGLDGLDELEAIDELDIADELSELEMLELEKTTPPSTLDEIAELFDVLAIEDMLDELNATLDELAIRLNALLDEITRLDVELDDDTGLAEAAVLDGLGDAPLEPEPPPHAVSDAIKTQENSAVKPGRKKSIATPNRHAGEIKKQLICRCGGIFLV